MTRIGSRRWWLPVALVMLSACGSAPPPGAQGSGLEAAAEGKSSPGSAGASVFARSSDIIHGIAGDGSLVFVTQPLARAVVAFDRLTGQEVGRLPAPAGDGFVLPFAARVPLQGHLVVLDAGGFPSPVVPSIPRIDAYDYVYDPRTHGFSAALTRTVKLSDLPVVFAEDIEVLEDGTWVMSESVIGALWLIRPDGAVAPAIFPSNPFAPLEALGGCPVAPFEIGGVPFAPGFAPGVGSLAVRQGQLYFGSSCKGGIYRVPIAALTDPARSPQERAESIVTVSARPEGTVEALKGLSFDPQAPGSPWLYATDPFRLRLLRIHVVTGRREVVSDDARLFNFSVATAFLPPLDGQPRLFVASDQEYRLAALNPALSSDQLQPPFLVTQVRVP
jgi:hypothetical protein